MQNFKTLANPLPGEKYVAEKEKKRRKIIPNKVDTVSLQVGLALLGPTSRIETNLLHLLSKLDSNLVIAFSESKSLTHILH